LGAETIIANFARDLGGWDKLSDEEQMPIFMIESASQLKKGNLWDSLAYGAAAANVVDKQSAGRLTASGVLMLRASEISKRNDFGDDPRVVHAVSESLHLAADAFEEIVGSGQLAIDNWTAVSQKVATRDKGLATEIANQVLQTAAPDSPMNIAAISELMRIGGVT
jgi:hypothetical protein